MFIEVIILSLIVGFILKGSIKNFKDVDLKHIELIFIGFAVETTLVILIRQGIILDNTIVYAFHMLMYIMLFIFIYLNKKMYQILIMGAGFFLNALAIFTNGGVMPVGSDAAIKAGMSNIINSISNEGLYKLVDNNTIFPFLCDVIPKPYPRAFVISAGDIFIAIGLFLLILNFMGCRKLGKKKEN